MKPIRVLLADDHSLVRAGIRALLQKIANVQVIAEAENGKEALELIDKHRPDIALLDIAMPEVDGLAAAAQVAQDFEQVRVIILSMYSDQEYVMRALRAGAKGYLLKGSRMSELELAITAVARGETYLSPAATIHLVDNFVGGMEGKLRPLNRLTPRQRQVLQLIAEGNSRKQIAQKLKLSAKTVDTFRAQLMEELGIHTVAGLVRFAISEGLISSRSSTTRDTK